MENQTKKNSTTKTIVVVGIIALIAYFLFRKPKETALASTSTPTPPLDNPKPTPIDIPIKRNPVDPIPVVPFVEPYRLPEGIYNGQRAVGSDGTQYVISENMKFGLTLEQWIARNYDAYEIVPQYKLDMVPNGGLWQGGLVLPL